jgi:outer membrane protein assembly factor BamB
MVVGAFLDRRGLGPWDLDRRLDLRTVGVVLVVAVAGALAPLDSRRARVAGTVLGTLGLVGTAVVVVMATGTGLPGPSTAVLAVGSTAVCLAAVAAGFLEPGPVPTAGRAVGVVRVTGLVLLVAGMCGVAVPVVVDAPVRASSVVPAPGAEVPAPLPGVPDRPTRVAWTWTTETGVRDVERAGTGVVVADDTGVTALDGPSGLPRWSFHRDGAGLRSLSVSPDGARVVLRHGATGLGDPDPGLLTVLDAATGARLTEIPLARVDGPLLVTDRIVAVPEPVPAPDDAPADLRRTDYVARDLGSGADQWRWRSPAECLQFAIYPLSTRSTVPVAAMCSGRLVVSGLAEDAGRERWRVDAGPGSDPIAVGLRATSDGSAVVALGTRPYPVIDTATGAVRTRITGGFPALSAPGAPLLQVGDGPDRREAALDPVTGGAVPLPAAPCAAPAATLVGSAATLRVCLDGSGGAVATVDGGAPIDLGVVDTDGSVLDPVADRARVRVVPAPGAVVVAGTSRGPTEVRGLA